jgi:UDP-glucuronate decarboxylase
VHPQSETYWGNVNPFGPRSCYDEGKRVAEALAYAYRMQYEVDICIARIFNAYGPRMLIDDGRAVSNFFAAALGGRDICINGDGKTTRCFQYVSDCIIGLVKLMESAQVGPFNIGSDTETTLEELGRMILDVVTQKTGKVPLSSLRLFPARQDDPVKRRPDITLAKEKLGWEPKIGLVEGLEASAEWFITLTSKDDLESAMQISSARN